MTPLPPPPRGPPRSHSPRVAGTAAPVMVPAGVEPSPGEQCLASRPTAGRAAGARSTASASAQSRRKFVSVFGECSCGVSVVGLRGKVLVAGGGCRDGFWEKLSEAFPMSDTASASWLEDRPATGQGQAHQ